MNRPGWDHVSELSQAPGFSTVVASSRMSLNVLSF